MDYVDIAGRFAAMGVKQGLGGEKSYFREKCVNISKMVSKYIQSYY